MVIIIYNSDTNYTEKLTVAILLRYNESAIITNSEQELFNQAKQGIDILFLPSKFNEIASFLSSINLCMQIIYLPPYNTPLPITSPNKNTYIFSDKRLEALLDKVIARSHQLKKYFFYLSNNHEKSILKDNIFYVDGSSHKSSFHMINSDIITINKKISDIIPYFRDSDHVIPHPFYLVKISAVIEIDMDSITLTTNEKLPTINPLRLTVIQAYFKTHFI